MNGNRTAEIYITNENPQVLYPILAEDNKMNIKLQNSAKNRLKNQVQTKQQLYSYAYIEKFLNISSIPSEFGCSQSENRPGCECYIAIRESVFPQIQKSNSQCFIEKLRIQANEFAQKFHENSDNIQNEHFKILQSTTKNSASGLYRPHPVYCVMNGYVTIKMAGGLGNQM